MKRRRGSGLPRPWSRNFPAATSTRPEDAGRFREFDPTHKIWLAANHKPVIRGTDFGSGDGSSLSRSPSLFRPSDKTSRWPKSCAARWPAFSTGPFSAAWSGKRKVWANPRPSLTPRGTTAGNRMCWLGWQSVDRAGRRPARAGELLAAYLKWSGDTRMSQRRLGEALTERGFDSTVIGGYTYRIGIGLRGEQHELGL